jgi:predicted nucleotidyltransferase
MESQHLSAAAAMMVPMDSAPTLEHLLQLRVDLVTRRGLRAERREGSSRGWSLFLASITTPQP